MSDFVNLDTKVERLRRLRAEYAAAEKDWAGPPGVRPYYLRGLVDGLDLALRELAREGS